MGKSVILDTNAVVSLLRNDIKLIKFISEAPSIGISVITQIEFLAFSNLTDASGPPEVVRAHTTPVVM